jgi:membrane fusion protein, multidrug efflux system
MSHSGDHRFTKASHALALAFLILTAGLGCSSSESDKRNPSTRAVPVTVGSVTQKSVPLQLRAIGTVQAVTTVSLRSLAGGEIVGVHFAEGQEVRKGDLLFTIDSRSYEATVRQAEATLAKDFAQVKQAEAAIVKDSAQSTNARVQAERYKSLVEKQLVAQEQYDQFRTNAEALEATLLADRAGLENAKAAVQVDRAALENAKIQLSYCSVRSPISGRIGNLLVHRGNVVKASDTQPLAVLAVVNQVSPVYVAFSLPEKNLPEIRKYMATEKLEVEAWLPNEDKPAEKGVVTFVDNAIDNSTGTIQLKGTFSNKAGRLLPGQFATAIITLAVQPDAIVVLTKAIQTGQQGQYVFVVKQDLTVDSRPVVVDRAINDETVIGKGLNPGETVVIDGQLQLIPGTKVEIKNPPSNGTISRKPA